jgi:hypothetical protein
LGEVVGVRTRKDLLVVVQTLGHRDQVVLDVGEIKSLEALSSGMTNSGDKWTCNIRGRCYPPVLVTSFCQPFDDVGLVAHESQQAHDLFPTGPNPIPPVQLSRNS